MGQLGGGEKRRRGGEGRVSHSCYTAHLRWVCSGVVWAVSRWISPSPPPTYPHHYPSQFPLPLSVPFNFDGMSLAHLRWVWSGVAWARSRSRWIFWSISVCLFPGFICSFFRSSKGTAEPCRSGMTLPQTLLGCKNRTHKLSHRNQ